MLSKVNKNTIFKNFNFNQNVKPLKPYLYTTYFILVIFIIIAIITYFLSSTDLYKNKFKHDYLEKFNETNEVLLQNKMINTNNNATTPIISTNTHIINRNKLYLINNEIVQIIPINILNGDNSHIVRKEPKSNENDYKYLSIDNKGNTVYKINKNIIESKDGGGNFERFVRLINKSKIGNESGTIQYYTSKFNGIDDIDSSYKIDKIVGYKLMDVMNNHGSLENSFFKYDDENDEGKYYEYYVSTVNKKNVDSNDNEIYSLINNNVIKLLNEINDIINNKLVNVTLKIASDCPSKQNWDYGVSHPGCFWIYEVLTHCSHNNSTWYIKRLSMIKQTIAMEIDIINNYLNIINKLSNYVGNYRSRYKTLLNEKTGTNKAMNFKLNMPNLYRISCGKWKWEQFNNVDEDIIENFISNAENTKKAEDLINFISDVQYKIINIRKHFETIIGHLNKIINLLQGTKITYDNLAINYTLGNINSYENRSNKSINIQELPYKPFNSNNEIEYLIFYIKNTKEVLYWKHSDRNIILSKEYNINQKIIDNTIINQKIIDNTNTYKFKVNKTDDGNYNINTKDDKNLLENINIVSYTENSDSYLVTKFINNYDKYYLMPHNGYKIGLNEYNTLLNPVDNIKINEFNKIHKFKKYDEKYKIFIIKYEDPFNDYPIPSSLIINDSMEITGKKISIINNININNTNHSYSIIYESNDTIYNLINGTKSITYTTDNINKDGRFKLQFNESSKNYKFTRYNNENIYFNYKMYDLGNDNIGLVDKDDNVMFFKDTNIINNFKGNKYNRFDLNNSNIKFKLIINNT